MFCHHYQTEPDLPSDGKVGVGLADGAADPLEQGRTERPLRARLDHPFHVRLQLVAASLFTADLTRFPDC